MTVKVTDPTPAPGLTPIPSPKGEGDFGGGESLSDERSD